MFKSLNCTTLFFYLHFKYMCAQQNNNKRNKHYITYNGKTQTMKQWADELNINYRTLKSRLNILGWSVENALNTPIAKGYTYLLPSDTVLDVVLDEK